MTPVAPFHGFALGFFRSSVFFVMAVGAFAETDKKTGTILVSLIFLIDVVSWHLAQIVTMTGSAVYNKTWFNVLTNRFVFETILDRFRDRQQIEFQSIVTDSTAAAREDIKKYLRDETAWSEWGWVKQTGAAIGLFLLHWLGYGIFYGIAGFIGSGMR